MTLKKSVPLYRLRLCEPIWMGQRIDTFRVEALTSATEWEVVAQGTTIGPRRLLRLPEKSARAIKVTVGSSTCCPLLSQVQLFLPPNQQE